MRVNAINTTIICTLTIKEAELLCAGLRAYNEKLIIAKSMTPQIKDEIVTAIMQLEDRIDKLKHRPEPDQKLYDLVERKNLILD